MPGFRILPLFIFLVACGGEGAADSSKSTTASSPEAEVAKASKKAARNGFDRTGEIVGTVNGAESAWQTLKMNLGGETRSTANYSNPVGLMTDFTLQGHKGGTFQIRDSVSVTFSLQGGKLVSGGALYFPEDSMFPHYGDHEGSVEITLEAIEIGDNSAKIKGVATGTLYKLSDYTSSPDMSDVIDVNLSFDTTAYKE